MVIRERLATKKEEDRDLSTTKVSMAKKVAVKEEKSEVITIEDDDVKKREVVLIEDEVEEKKEVVTIVDDEEDEKKAEEDEIPQTPARRRIFKQQLLNFNYNGATGSTRSATTANPSPKRERDEDSTSEAPTPSSSSSTQSWTAAAPRPKRRREEESTSAAPTPSSSSTMALTSTHIEVTTSTTSTPPRQRRRRRERSGYAPPSTYEHLNHLNDAIGPGLICLFVGLNPGLRTAQTGHAYSHPTNLFWRLLHSSGCTTRRCAPEEDQDLPRLFALGNTNIVARPTRNQAELSRAEMVTSVSILEAKVREHRPEAVCLVGKGIWESVWQARHGRRLRPADFRYGWQSQTENIGRVTEPNGQEWAGAKVFVATSTSGLAANTKPWEKEEIWRPLGEWVQQRRAEREV